MNTVPAGCVSGQGSRSFSLVLNNHHPVLKTLTVVNIFVIFIAMKWEITYYNAALQQEIMSLPVGMQARYIHLTRRMIEETIVMLHSFVKKTQKTPAKELNKAKQRLKEVKNVNP